MSKQEKEVDFWDEFDRMIQNDMINVAKVRVDVKIDKLINTIAIYPRGRLDASRRSKAEVRRINQVLRVAEQEGVVIKV